MPLFPLFNLGEYMSFYDTSAWFHWDPSKDLFTIPLIDRVVAWYGVFFALGFVVGYFAILRIFTRYLKSKDQALILADSLLWYVVVGTIIGARLGHVFFYAWPMYEKDLWSIFKVWEGGLASHGGGIGILLGLTLFRWRNYRRFSSVNFFVLLDALAISSVFAGGCIRIGNFFNQEILGTVTTVPWAVVFGHPADGGAVLPRHPVQMYESLFYFFVFSFLYHIWRKDKIRFGVGIFSGLFFTLVFSFRFLIEFFKQPLSMLLSENSFLSMGQYLSLPFIIVGIVFLLRAKLSLSQEDTTKTTFS